MAQDKKTIIVYADWEEYFIDLSNEEAGKLIKHFFAYVNDKNPNFDDRFLDLAFKPMKLQLKRDLDKWEQIKLKRIEAGRAGGLRSGEVRSNQNEANEASASSSKQNEANEAVNVNVNVINNIPSDFPEEENGTLSDEPIESNQLLIDQTEPEEFNPLHFFIAKSYHNFFLKSKGKIKTLTTVQTKTYIDTIRKMIDIDGVTVQQLIAVKMFLDDSIADGSKLNPFWANNTYSMAKFRTKKNDVYRWDMVKKEADKWGMIEGNVTRVTKAHELLMQKVRNSYVGV